MFAPDLKVEVSGGEIPFDTSHIYTGEIYGKAALLILTPLSNRIAGVNHLTSGVRVPR